MTTKFKPSYTSSIAEDIMAERLLRAKAVEFLTETPMRLKSGLISPVYVDNRKLYYDPEAWSDVIETMASRVEEFGLEFDVVAGVTKRAPAIWQKLGMEWFYRFIQEPRRLWKRYVVGNAQFIRHVNRAVRQQKKH